MTQFTRAARLVAVFAVLSLTAGTRPVEGQSVQIHNGFGTAQQYLDMSHTEQTSYAMGVVNGMLVTPLLGVPEKDVAWLGQCVEGMNNYQVAAIIAKHIKENPERWHYGLHVESWWAIKKACGK